ncbi:zinc finger HIT domain-containing protein 2 [Lutzomyia longipalpis]|uniref:zinc finger HIT domain-containing protein 2 n=1 Tax=Lutzomyia longipalpis TaxID=7200 RepID=UPI002483A1B6|nr:zinc finger HIT domain-containing protein 2 [Lutzomyia longipalpis]
MSSMEKDFCELCTKEKAKYSCPRCNLLYCSVPCYQSQAHLQCSENFYRECIEEEMVSTKNPSEIGESTKKMYEILKRMKHLDDNGEEDDIEEIFNPSLNESSGESDLDSDDDTPAADLACRLDGVDLNDPEAVWSKLTKEEQQEFESIINAGDITNLVPVNTPWWVKLSEEKLVREASSVEESNHPEILSNIRNFKEISRITPAPCVRHNLTNILAAYAFSVRYFNGDYVNNPQEFAGLLANISGNIKCNANYDSDLLAIESVAHEAQNEGIALDSETKRALQEDVEMILRKSPQNIAVLAALSDIHRILASAKKPKEKEKSSSGVFSKKFIDRAGLKEIEQSRIRVYLKKIEFFLAFSKDIL